MVQGANDFSATAQEFGMLALRGGSLQNTIGDADDDYAPVSSPPVGLQSPVGGGIGGRRRGRFI
eukprot:1190403-Prorocentrum_minimum.AAC.6